MSLQLSDLLRACSLIHFFTSVLLDNMTGIFVVIYNFGKLSFSFSVQLNILSHMSFHLTQGAK